MQKSRWQSGLSMVEVLIVTAIIGLLVIIAITTLPEQLRKGRDGRRKSDLQKIKIAFENYYSDNDCYPPPEILDNCGSEVLSPYMASIPCDPQTKTKYLYAPEASSCPQYYRVFSNLELDIDPVIKQLGCHTGAGCGAYAFFGDVIGEAALEYNYGVSEGVPVYNPDGNLPPGSSGWCCAVAGDQCNSWTEGGGVCNYYFPIDQQIQCDSYCQGIESL
jgi:prepilin-type N-terminal cleavage/methylation domain-containing protein